jgi:hypothetical protein
MARRAVVAIAAAALLLELLPVVAAHGDEHAGGSMDMGAHNAAKAQAQDEGPRSYWSLSEHATLMYWHIALEIVAWLVVLPVGELPLLWFKIEELY